MNTPIEEQIHQMSEYERLNKLINVCEAQYEEAVSRRDHINAQIIHSVIANTMNKLEALNDHRN